MILEKTKLKRKVLAEYFGIFESLLNQNLTKQDSQLSWFF